MSSAVETLDRISHWRSPIRLPRKHQKRERKPQEQTLQIGPQNTPDARAAGKPNGGLPIPNKGRPSLWKGLGKQKRKGDRTPQPTAYLSAANIATAAATSVAPTVPNHLVQSNLPVAVASPLVNDEEEPAPKKSDKKKKKKKKMKEKKKKKKRFYYGQVKTGASEFTYHSPFTTGN
jgi:hypothetical protein